MRVRIQIIHSNFKLRFEVESEIEPNKGEPKLELNCELALDEVVEFEIRR